MTIAAVRTSRIAFFYTITVSKDVRIEDCTALDGETEY